ncbi:hypothetical protein [Actibacterium ureilyticum]|uniref:hypothetical protein n=1 Tax=Actibacterium ureilyticum TaxID=1590614 RepID=UPI000BAB20E1|nr:hypothetical protein [Actibacterium ureilyticum]
MFHNFIHAYVLFFAVLLPGITIGLVALNAQAAGLGPSRAIRAVIVTAGVFGLWYAVASMVTRSGLMMPPPTITDPPYVMMFMLGGAGTLWALARLTATGRAISDEASHAQLIGFQIPRIMGGVFLIGWALGEIPWQFALPAGLGDIWAGIAGYTAMRAAARGDADAEAKIQRANVIGLADFVVAVLTGLMTSEGFLHLMSHDAPNIINADPLGLFPGFFVAIFLAFHAVSLSRLRRGSIAAQRA